MRTLKVRIGVNADNKITFIEPLNRATGKAVEIIIVTVRLITEDDEFDSIEQLMQEGRTYKRINRRVREIR